MTHTIIWFRFCVTRALTQFDLFVTCVCDCELLQSKRHEAAIFRLVTVFVTVFVIASFEHLNFFSKRFNDDADVDGRMTMTTESSINNKCVCILHQWSLWYSLVHWLCVHVTVVTWLVCQTAVQKGPRSNFPHAADSSVFLMKHHYDTQLWAGAAHLLQCLGWLSLSSSVVRWIEYRHYGWVIIQMANDKCMAYGSR